MAAALLLRLVDTALPLVSASGLHFCRLGRLLDSCFGIALRLLFPSEASQVSSYTSPQSPLPSSSSVSVSPNPSLYLSPCVLTRFSSSTCACLSSQLLRAWIFLSSSAAFEDPLRFLCLGRAAVMTDCKLCSHSQRKEHCAEKDRCLMGCLAVFSETVPQDMCSQ